VWIGIVEEDLRPKGCVDPEKVSGDEEELQHEKPHHPEGRHPGHILELFVGAGVR